MTIFDLMLPHKNTKNNGSTFLLYESIDAVKSFDAEVFMLNQSSLKLYSQAATSNKWSEAENIFALSIKQVLILDTSFEQKPKFE